MPPELRFDAAHTAMLAMDVQTGIVSIYAKSQQDYLDRSSRVLRAARAAGLPVIFVRVGFRPGLPEISDRNQLFAAMKTNPQHQKLFEDKASDIHPALGPEENDIVVTKHRVSAFTGTDLEMILRAKEIRTLALFGIATSGVVLSRLLEARDANFQVIVIGDCCADTDENFTGRFLSGYSFGEARSPQLKSFSRRFDRHSPQATPRSRTLTSGLHRNRTPPTFPTPAGWPVGTVGERHHRALLYLVSGTVGGRADGAPVSADSGH